MLLMPTPQIIGTWLQNQPFDLYLMEEAYFHLCICKEKNKTKQPAPILLRTQPHPFVKSKAVQLFPQGLGHTTLTSSKMYFGCLVYKETSKNESALQCRNSQIWWKVLNKNKNSPPQSHLEKVTLIVAVQDQYLSVKIL